MELADIDVNKRDLGSGEMWFELSPEPTNHFVLLDLESIPGVLNFCAPMNRKR